MFAWLRTIAPSATPLLNLLAGWALKGFLILALAYLITLVLRRRTAAARHLVWTLAVVATIAAPLLSVALPSWKLMLPVPRAVRLAEERLAPALGDPVISADRQIAAPAAAEPVTVAGPATSLPATPVPGRQSASTHAPVAPPSHRGGMTWLVGIWAAGALVCLLPLVLGMFSLHRLARGARPITAGPLHRLFERLVAEGGHQPRAIRLLESSRRLMPMTWGIRRPIILLPAEAQNWAEERLKMVILHELAHVRRYDFLTQLLARLTCALHWFNPLAWLALARMRVEQERACDDLALAQGLDAPAYAGHLLAIVSAAGRSRGVPAMASAMASSSQVEARLRLILDSARNRRPLGRRHVAFASFAMVFLLTLLATARVESASHVFVPELVSQEKTQDQPEQLSRDQVQVLERVQRLYVTPPDKSRLVDGAIQGILDALHDPYASYIRPEELATMERALSASVVGIGVQIGEKDGRIVVVLPIPDSPAQRAGIRPDDEIAEIDGQPTKGMDLNQVVKRIVGPAGTVVKLKVVHRDGSDAVLEITRANIKLHTALPYSSAEKVRSKWMIDADNHIGYAQVTQFASATPGELKEAIRAMQDQGMKGLILDLRSCPGGMLQAAVDVANLFLKGGPIVAIRGRTGDEKVTQADPEKSLADFPLVVLINEQTASAAEIVSGALQSRDRAVLIGTRTVGKGSIQTIVKLDDGGGAIKLTTAYYTLPGGRKIDRSAGATDWGVDPSEDDFVPMDARLLEKMQTHRRSGSIDKPDPDDVQLAAALKAMAAKLRKGEFARVGQPRSALIAYVNRLDEIRKRRDSLRKDLEKVEKELDELDRAQPDAKP